jgi:hypothetical protein
MIIDATIEVVIDDAELLIVMHGDPENPDVRTALEAALDAAEIPGCSISASILRMATKED